MRFILPVMALAVLLPQASFAQSYAFTNIADTSMTAPGGGSYTSFNYSPAINDAGELVVLAGQAIYRGTPGALTRLAQTTDAAPGVSGTYQSFPTPPRINATGQVLFAAAAGSGSQFIASPSSTISLAFSGNTPIQNAAGRLSTPYFVGDINASGTVFYVGSRKPDPSASAIEGAFSYSNGVLRMIANRGDVVPGTGGETISNVLQRPDANDAGHVAFTASTDSRSHLVVHDGTQLVRYLSTGTALPGGGQVTTIGASSLNNAGTVAFLGTAGLSPVTLLVASVTSSGALSEHARVGKPGPGGANYTNLGPATLNDAGVALFSGSQVSTDALDTIFLASGGQTTRVIGVGDSLFDSVVVAVETGRQSLNNAGQISFRYQLANGRTGVALAGAAAPEPSAVALTLCTLSVLPFLRRLRL